MGRPSFPRGLHAVQAPAPGLEAVRFACNSKMHTGGRGAGAAAGLSDGSCAAAEQTTGAWWATAVLHVHALHCRCPSLQTPCCCYFDKADSIMAAGCPGETQAGRAPRLPVHSAWMAAAAGSAAAGSVTLPPPCPALICTATAPHYKVSVPQRCCSRPVLCAHHLRGLVGACTARLRSVRRS